MCHDLREIFGYSTSRVILNKSHDLYANLTMFEVLYFYMFFFSFVNVLKEMK